MKKKPFIILFITVQILGMVLYIHHRTRLVRQTYKKQQNETLVSTLQQKKQDLLHHLYALRDPATITAFAQQKLQMDTVHLSQIHRFTSGVEHE